MTLIRSLITTLPIIAILLMILYIIILFVWIVPTAEKLEKSISSKFYKPILEQKDGEIVFQCHIGTYYDEVSHSSILSQLSSFTSIAGLIFNITYYGVTSKFKLTTTCLLDDFLILTFFLIPVVSWFFTTKFAVVFHASFITCLSLFVLSFLAVLIFTSITIGYFHRATIFHQLNYFEKSEKSRIRSRSLGNPKRISVLEKSDFYYNRQSNYEWIKHFIIVICFFESILIMIYDVKQIYDEGTPADVIINLELLRWIFDIIYFLLVSFVSFRFFFRKKIPKRASFCIILVSIMQVFFEYALYCTPKGADSIFLFILTTILTRTISSFFSNDNFKDIRVKDIEHYGIKNCEKEKNYKFVFLRILQEGKISDYLGHQRLYIQVNDNDEKMKAYIKNIQEFYRKQEYIYVTDAYKQLTEQLGGRKKRCYYKRFIKCINKVIKTDYGMKVEDDDYECYLCKIKKSHPRINIATTDNHFIQIKTIETSDKIQITEDSTDYENTFIEIISEKFKNPVGITRIFGRYYNIVDNEFNIPGTKIISKYLSENNVKVYANVLEMGYFQYFVYSHRAYKDDKRNKKYDKADIKISCGNYNIVFTNSNVRWYVIPGFGTSIYTKKDNNDREYKECKALENILNNIEVPSSIYEY
ncbi:17533_t:CDS:1 [Cetraspora pellucida]|uniref:17533_t:CDS:1 n=1 Tax=Cetraspora pellucida TaxID=1433469 RepID=A0A9N9N966_9GLOM|nr:17533_t:CDS:1 [Cetraspora pellucida]